MTSIEDLRQAADWLDCNEGDESAACRRVAEMLNKMADRRERDAIDRATRSMRGEITLGDIMDRLKAKTGGAP